MSCAAVAGTGTAVITRVDFFLHAGSNEWDYWWECWLDHWLELVQLVKLGGIIAGTIGGTVAGIFSITVAVVQLSVYAA